MGLYVNGTTIAPSAGVYVNGAAMTNVYINGTLVWTKAASGVTWKTAWTGNLIIDPYAQNLGSVAQESGIMEAMYTGMTNASMNYYITQGLVQLDANAILEVTSTSGAPIDTVYMDTLTANLASTNTKSNLPWSPTSSQIGAELLMPYQSGSAVYQRATTGYKFMCGALGWELFEVTAFYYGIKN